jgi:hypothetical protein
MAVSKDNLQHALSGIRGVRGSYGNLRQDEDVHKQRLGDGLAGIEAELKEIDYRTSPDGTADAGKVAHCRQSIAEARSAADALYQSNVLPQSLNRIDSFLVG